MKSSQWMIDEDGITKVYPERFISSESINQTHLMVITYVRTGNRYINNYKMDKIQIVKKGSN